MKKILLFLGLLAAGTGCRKKEATLQQVNVSDTLRQAVAFRQGSFFVYQETGTGLLDSFWVSKLSTSYSQALSKPGAEYETISCTLEHAAGSLFYIGTNAWEQLVTGQFQQVNTTFFAYPFHEGAELLEKSGSGAILYRAYKKWDDTLSIRNVQYRNVCEISSYNISADKKDTQYLYTFYASPAGLIKYSTRYNSEAWHTWELKTSFIVR